MPLIVRDNLIPERLVRAAIADWPSRDWQGWHQYPNGKLASRCVDQAPQSIRAALNMLAMTIPIFTREAFPDLSFYGAGLHELPAGVALDWHRDAERHPLKPWRRTETALLYLDAGGDLVFRGGLVERIEPRVGRSVVFLPDDETEHAVEPSDERRRSLAVFFYVIDSSCSGSTCAEFCRA